MARRVRVCVNDAVGVNVQVVAALERELGSGWHYGVLCFRQQWPCWSLEPANWTACATYLCVNHNERRFPTADFGGHVAAAPAFETRAHWARKGHPFGMDLEEYLTPDEEIKRSQHAALRSCDRDAAVYAGLCTARWRTCRRTGS